MNKLKSSLTLTALCFLIFHVSTNAEGFIKKEVYSFKDENGNTVFTDKQPSKKLTYKTQTIEAANSTGNTHNSNNYDSPSNRVDTNTKHSVRTIKIIVDDNTSQKKISAKKKKNAARCKTYKKKHQYYSDKLRSGYKNSEYKKLESNRIKYRDLLFNHCETKTFSD